MISSNKQGDDQWDSRQRPRQVLYFSFVELDTPNACREHTLGVLSGFGYHGCKVDALIPRPISAIPALAGVRFVRLWPWRFSAIGQVWMKLLALVAMFCLCLLKRYDFIYAREMEINPGPRLCATIFKVPLFLEINELLVPYFKETGAGSALIRQVAKSQSKDFRQAEAIIVPSVPMRKWLINHYGLPPAKVHLVFNGVQLPQEGVWDRHSALLKLGIAANSFCLGFIGNLYPRYDFETVFGAMRLCHSRVPVLHWLIVGDGPMKVHLQHRVDQLKMKNRVTFTGYIDPDQLGRYLPAMDLGLVTMNSKVAARYGPITTKVPTYGAFRVPVVTSGNSWEGHPTVFEKSVYLIPPQDPIALSDLIVYLYQNKKDRQEKAGSFCAYVQENMTWTTIAGRIIRLNAINKSASLEAASRLY